MRQLAIAVAACGSQTARSVDFAAVISLSHFHERKPMFRRIQTALLVVSLLAALVSSATYAASNSVTTIRVKDMHCEACAAKIRRGLFSVAGVVSVKTDVKTHVAFVIPQQDRQPSPRAMWEAVEKAGFQVVQLEGPRGTFTEKPPQ